MTSKECGYHHDEKRKFIRRILIGVGSITILILFIILLIFLILRPTKPTFVLQDITVYAFNVSSPNFLTSNLQITLTTRNPNNRIGIYYDRVNVYASYRTQQVTLSTMLPTTYQGHKDIVTWSPFLYGNLVPVAPYLCESLSQDQMAGTMLLNIRVDGRVRWKVGTFISGRYRLYANCPAYINFGKPNNGIAFGPAMKYQLVLQCHVDV
ncbi:hypothetical protein LIER_15188 [Lithospermum erythrorhizon]|uniref:Late embryogenesis abundant protein LEA-2 subgroup domain-containing protein n=1 Tax=Lithospermum erythrorhizon TaxID=34254 RepID=A0AAV3Q3H8_LITER